MENRNICYATREIAGYYSQHRRRWDELYPSERWVFEQVARRVGALGSVLDVGCACGGLAEALCEKKLGVSSYHGVDINEESIRLARRSLSLPIPLTFTAMDIVEAEGDETFDTVASLGCADWNIETERIMSSCWKRVCPGGHLIVSLRLTHGEGVNDILRSSQFINFSGARREEAEVANYVVFNVHDALRAMASREPQPSLVGAYGYWGTPSSTARTPYERLVFAVFWVRKAAGPVEGAPQTELHLPLDLMLGVSGRTKER